MFLGTLHDFICPLQDSGYIITTALLVRDLHVSWLKMDVICAKIFIIPFEHIKVRIINYYCNKLKSDISVLETID
jgi:hypothetical protein